MNTGLDPIIECINLNVNINPVPQVSRFLIEFDQGEINNVVDNIIGNQQWPYRSPKRGNSTGKL